MEDIQYWVSYKGSCPNSVASTLKAISFDSFANIKVALRILATLPVTSCECERSFSAIRRLKDYTRNTMVEERLNGLALMEIHQDIEPSVQQVIDKLSADSRRIELIELIEPFHFIDLICILYHANNYLMHQNT